MTGGDKPSTHPLASIHPIRFSMMRFASFVSPRSLVVR